MLAQRFEGAKPQSLFFKALANSTRMSIVDLLQTGPRTVTEICGDLGFEQSMVSHHLACLSFCGFVTHERNGKSKIYSLNSETIAPILKIVGKHLEKFASNLYRCETLER